MAAIAATVRPCEDSMCGGTHAAAPRDACGSKIGFEPALAASNRVIAFSTEICKCQTQGMHGAVVVPATALARSAPTSPRDVLKARPGQQFAHTMLWNDALRLRTFTVPEVRVRCYFTRSGDH